MIDNSEILESVHFYRENKIQVLPVPHGQKNIEIQWKRYQQDFIESSQIKDLFAHNENIAGLGGCVSENYCVIDVDNVEIFNRTLAQNNLFKEFRNQTWESVSASGRPHIHFKAPYPIQTKNLIKDFGIEIRGEGTYVLLPPSVFQKNGQGLLYYWIKRDKLLQLNESDTNDLSRIIPLERKIIIPNKTKPFGLSWKYFEILVFGEFEKHGFNKNNKGESYSEAEFQGLLHLVSLGWNDQKIISFISEKAHHKTNFKTRKDDINYLGRSLDNAQKWVKNNQSENDRKIQELVSLSSRINWNQASRDTRTAITDKLVYDYILEIAQRTGKTNLSLPGREIAERIGRTQITVSKSLNRLSGILIQQTKNSDLINGTEYSLCHKDSILHIVGKEGLKVNDTNFRKQDIWRRSNTKGRLSLEKTGMLIWEYIETKNDKIEIKEIVSAMSSFSSRETVYRKLKLMKDLGMIEKTERGWIQKRENVDFKDIAHRIDSEGKEAKQKEQHRKDREFERSISKLTKDEKRKARTRRNLSRNPYLTKLDLDTFLNEKTGEIFEVK